MGTVAGAQKRWAKRFGMTYQDYMAKVGAGLKRCQKCRQWKGMGEYAADSSRSDGLHTRCHTCCRVKVKKKPTMPEWAKEALRERNRKHKWAKGTALSQEQREHLRQLRIQEGRWIGADSPNWKGGITPENRILRRNSQYQQWRVSVFKRDNYTCQNCGDSQGSNLVAHHVKPWAVYLELRYELDNGLTLCQDCHKRVHSKIRS